MKMQGQKRARILIVDDHPAVRDALALRIGQQPDMEVCGEADDVAEALRLVLETNPDVAVIDITLKTATGIDLIKRIREHEHPVHILVWSMHSESLYAERALRAGALGYISKDKAMGTMIEAIHRVMEGEVYLSEAMSKKLAQRRGSEPKQSPIDVLADRELEVFRLIGEGIKTAEIARRLDVSVKTIETYRDRIRRKLNLSDGTDLLIYALRWALNPH